ILSNAVYHRSYQVSEPITVRITPKNIEITSFPGFDRSISDESIANYSIRARVYRNRRIGDFLKELHLIEGRNTGFPNAIKALRENGSELLTFDMDENRSYLSVTIPVHSYFLKKNEQTDKKAAYEKKITDALKDKPLTLTELAAAMNYKGITKKLTNTVNNMLARNILEKTTGEGSVNKLKIK
ncbi:MAG: AAA family ATPase, partial [Oscillospiraceae bacterium]|nr:AAA family ATPase [Oscillospiraceae bacterium]